MTVNNQSTTERKVLDNYYTCSVGFVHWDTFDVVILSIEDLEAQSVLTGVKKDWASLLVSLLRRSFGMSLESRGEFGEFSMK
jgi:hypothetical protein